MSISAIVFEALCGLFLLAMMALAICGFRKTRRFIYLRVEDKENGKSLPGLPVYALRNSRYYQSTWLADRGGQPQYAYEAVNSQYRRKIGETNLLGEFRHCIRWKATYGFEVGLPGGGNRLLYADHIGRQGAYPASPTIIKA